jgi:hypothetical protein
MGFFSGLFGSSSEWDASKYVENFIGTKYWHENFIDKDEMRRLGQLVAHEFDPTGPSTQKQSPNTIVGELVFLLEATRLQNDKDGARNVARAIENLLSTHEAELPRFARMKFISVGYMDNLF